MFGDIQAAMVRQTRWRRVAKGAVLALGAPVAWALLVAIRGASPLEDIAAHPDLYLYLLIPTTVAFAGSGAIIGWHEEKLEQANRELGEMAVTDALTRLKNLRYFRARLSEEHARYLRTGEPLALAIIDLDRFKRVNDEFGHQIGDRLLTAVGLATAGVARQARVRVAVGEVVVATPSGPIRVTASVGIASTDYGANAVDELYGRADEALYVAKRPGRDRIACLGRDVATQGAPA